MTLGVSDVFAGYTIIRLLGAGGMGEVYLAQHPRLPRREALKILRHDISTDETFRQRFIREADSIAALEHPNIVTVHDRGDSDDRLWLATQYVDGTDAAKRLRDGYPAGMPADEALTITTAIAEALDYAHDRGLLHRDVKPANILLAQPDRDGNRRAYLADFGIARPLDDPAGLTSTNFTLGTFAYAAPEQLMGKAIDGRADQYALAATAYHLLTGTPMFSHSNQVAVISQHLTEPAPAPSSIRTELAPFDAAFARALAKTPEHRFPRCREFAHALAEVSTKSGIAFSPTAPTQQAPVPSAAPAPGATWRRSPPRGLLSTAVFMLLIAGGLLWHPWAHRGEPPISTPTTTAPATTNSTSPTPPAMTTPASASAPSPPPVTSNPSPPPQTPATPPRPTCPPAGQLGSACPPPGGAIGTGPDGAIYYCERIEGTDGYEWALTPGLIPNPVLHQPLNIPPGSPCMVPGGTADTTSGTLYCKLTAYGQWLWLPGP
jgi:serine/threonine protein kinase, bacterial